MMIDYHLESWTLKTSVQEKFLHLQTFIESGSFAGGGIQQALDVGFKNIHSIEINDEYYAHVQARYEKEARVKCWHGDSRPLLPIILQKVRTPALVFLDGHAESDSPLIEELHVLARSTIKHTIVVDDVDMILNRIGWGRSIKFHQLFDALARLPGYRLKVLDSKLSRRSQWLLTPMQTGRKSQEVIAGQR
jgi:hypothetical protein